MIALGLDDQAKRAEIAAHQARHDITKTFTISPKHAVLDGAWEHIPYEESFWYKYYYRLLQTIDKRTLLVINECARSRNRHELVFNCIRQYAHQTPHVLVFQHLPFIDTWEDFGVLFDFATKSMWKREKVTQAMLSEAQIRVEPMLPELRPIAVPVDAKTAASYAREKAALLAEVRGDPSKDPHNIPRNLYLLGGKAKLAHVDPARSYVGRNTRFKLPNLSTYREERYDRGPYTVFELPHNFIDFTDFLFLSRQRSLDVLVAELKVDRWYLDRYQAWVGRLREAYAMLGAPC